MTAHQPRREPVSDARPALTLLTEEESAFREAVREFAESTIKPRVAAMDRAATMDPEVIQACFDMGLMSVEVPEQYGGQGGTFFMAILAIEELARVDPAVSVMVDVQTTLVQNMILRWGSEEIKQWILPQISKDKVAAYCLSEAGSGSDAFALACEAREDGDAYVLDGHKLWITNAGEAEFFAVFATVDKSLRHRGITCFLVEREQKGFSVSKKEDKLGIRASSTCEILLEGVRVPKSRILGEVGKGYKVAIETLNEGRIGIGAQMVGLARGAFEGALAYVQERKQFGRPIGENQGVQFQLAEMAARIRAARLLVWDAARRRDAGEPFLTEAAYAKLVASRAAEYVASEAVNLFGGNGFTKEYPIEKFYRDAKIGQIYEGTTNMQLQTIAKQLLGGATLP
ncbi:MAG: acyl-CoA dehydrogenase [Planctomycetota bacterium]|nr:MAG: acyl-CoA dehydrogenase [Planctomycetota bacterium]